MWARHKLTVLLFLLSFLFFSFCFVLWFGIVCARRFIHHPGRSARASEAAFFRTFSPRLTERETLQHLGKQGAVQADVNV